MHLSVEDLSLHVMEMGARVPLRAGSASLLEVPHLMLRAVVRIDGRLSVGVAADGLVPQWSAKRRGETPGQEIAELLSVAKAAGEHARALEPQPTVYDFWRALQWRQARAYRDTSMPPLVYNFGMSLVERAVIDAFCHARIQPFAEAVRRNALGIRLGEIYPELAGREPASLLPDRPLTSLIVRHTVGVNDPLTPGEIAAGDRCDDGLPQSLESCIQQYGLTHFKIKLCGDARSDLKRLTAVAKVIETECRRGFWFTLDGDEQYVDVAGFVELWQTLRRDVLLKPFMRRLLYVVQPLHRQVALTQATAAALAGWRDPPRIIVDSSDDHADTLGRALECGYAGTSHRNAKGVIKSIANACLIEHRNRQAGDVDRDDRDAAPFILSAEDFTCVGPVALLQDLAVAAALGIEHGERCGHHYFSGLSMWPPAVQRQTLAAHSDLYHAHDVAGTSFPTLTIRQGRIDVSSVVAAPFGPDFNFDPTEFPTI